MRSNRSRPPAPLSPRERAQLLDALAKSPPRERADRAMEARISMLMGVHERGQVLQAEREAERRRDGFR